MVGLYDFSMVMRDKASWYYGTKPKELAQKDRRSLNNYVECLLLDAVYHEPNEETIAALNDAKAGKLEGPIDTSSVEAMLKSMDL